MQLLLKLKFGNVNEAICVSPKITSILGNKFEAYIRSSLEYHLEKYCETDYAPYFEKTTPFVDKIYADINFPRIIQTIKSGLDPRALSDFIMLANKISSFNFQQIQSVSSKNIVQGFNILNAVVSFLEKLLNDPTKFNTRE
mgnify:CR=1 FL=1